MMIDKKLLKQRYETVWRHHKHANKLCVKVFTHKILKHSEGTLIPHYPTDLTQLEYIYINIDD
jgi:hypothetical protein